MLARAPPAIFLPKKKVFFFLGSPPEVVFVFYNFTNILVCKKYLSIVILLYLCQPHHYPHL